MSKKYQLRPGRRPYLAADGRLIQHSLRLEPTDIELRLNGGRYMEVEEEPQEASEAHRGADEVEDPDGEQRPDRERQGRPEWRQEW